MKTDFIQRISRLLEEHLSEEQFGVSELASKTGMSRSNLLRKIKAQTGKSASQFIRDYRLDRSRTMLLEEDLTVSEISYAVGFASSSYFTKCFREKFGHTPGELSREEVLPEEAPDEAGPSGNVPMHKFPKWLIWAGAGSLAAVALILLFLVPGKNRILPQEKSIAVLPFHNESSDASNLYLINGLMEAVLNDLQKIEDLRVISRTSVEKFREVKHTAQEIGSELDAAYLVTGSGQKYQNQISLNVQLVDARNDQQLWSGHYLREDIDIFELQKEVSASIAREIQARITPEEQLILEKRPTDNLEAYDFFLKGLNQFYVGSTQGLDSAVYYFKEAVKLDPEFARAHADIGIAYAFLDIFAIQKSYLDEVKLSADRALELDSTLAQGLIARGLYHTLLREYQQALPFFEKALETNPNSSLAINMLSNHYANYVPNTEKYLEYALRGMSLDMASRDSMEIGMNFMHVSNAFIQSGFIEEAHEYIRKALAYHPGNFYADIIRAYILYAQGGSLDGSREILEALLSQYPGNLDLLKELGNLSYYLRDFQESFRYYNRWLRESTSQGLPPSRGEFAKIGVVMARTGHQEASDTLFKAYKHYAEEDQSVYKHLSLAVYYAWEGQTEASVREMELFSKMDRYPYWYVLFLATDPLLDEMYQDADFSALMEDITRRFWDYHEQMRRRLVARGVL